MSTDFPLTPFALVEPDLLAELLQDKRSPNTRRTYAKSLRDFFQALTQQDPTPEIVGQFLQLNRFEALRLVLRYRATLVEKGLSPATINVRLAAIKSLVNYARRVGKCDYTLEEVEGLRVHTYRDTTGIQPESFRQITAHIDGESLKGKRDLAILRLLWDNALRRAEVCTLNIEDYDSEAAQLWIKGKGKLTKEAVRLSDKAILLIDQWLQAMGRRAKSKPLFCTLDRATFGHRLSGNAIYTIVRSAAETAGLSKTLSPHRIRHSAITAALEATQGDTRKVQKLSRHSNLNTLMIYDDNRHHHQAEVTEILSQLI
ncbi:tyrosine-type recombinase/integrase [Synechocystis sp. LKSZ1]|uniref:tyrosine-type recombinase/integrase n=1 Tax=Synechocystis sp. LKSZ1 TaxID=3144951 RepID=UPI00336BF1A2